VRHLRYLRYVLLHKWYVALAGLVIAWAVTREHRLRLTWRLLVHDLSKFRPDEWRPYVEMFYGKNLLDDALRGHGLDVVDEADPRYALIRREVDEQRRSQRYAFNVAWLKHQHRNDHHWQHWLLKQDEGPLLQLLPPAYVVDEMVADWLGAGSKVLKGPALVTCVAETVVWYTEHQHIIQLRTQARERVESILVALARRYGLMEYAQQVQGITNRRVKVMVPVPLPDHDTR